MEESKLKNMVVLKNLPSNIVEEAIVILKETKKVKKLEKIDKNKTMEFTKRDKKEKDYVLKEAEMLVATYINQLEKKKEKREITNKKINKKIKKLKAYSAILSIILFIETLILMIK